MIGHDAEKTSLASVDTLRHHARDAWARSHEAHRVATPLELLFDLTFAAAFGLAASHSLTRSQRATMSPFRRLWLCGRYHLLGVDQFLVVLVRLQRRRLDRPERDDGADARGACAWLDRAARAR
jgi:hypothetical protein